jgi:fermentation-respiration switch protein FrsA (DUF1100 family)
VTMISISLFLLLVLLGVGYFLAGLVIHIRTYGDEDIYKYETNAGTLVREDIESLPKDEVFIHSPYGYRLRGLFFKAPQDTGKAIVLVHGVSTSLVSSLKYMWMFHKRGFHVLAYDHCRHGGSGGSITTFGFYEKHDLNACVDWLFESVGQNCKIGIFGESMGASTALQHAAIDKRATFYIADCPFSDLTAELKYRLRKYWCVPPFPLLHITRLLAWLRSGFHFHLVSPIRNMAEIETPILFIHGKEDKNIPMEMTLELYRAKKGPKQLYLVSGADHAQSLRTNPHIYDRVVGEFLEELGLVTTEIKTSNSEETKGDEFTDQNAPLDTSGFEESVLYDELAHTQTL